MPLKGTSVVEKKTKRRYSTDILLLILFLGAI